jgi:hypothetical protein
MELVNSCRFGFRCAITHFMVQSPSWEANRSSVTREISRRLRNQKFHYPPIVTILSQINPIHTLPSSVCHIRHNTILPSKFMYSKWFISVMLPYRIPVNAFIFSPMSAVCPVHHILPGFIILIRFDEKKIVKLLIM